MTIIFIATGFLFVICFAFIGILNSKLNDFGELEYDSLYNVWKWKLKSEVKTAIIGVIENEIYFGDLKNHFGLKRVVKESGCERWVEYESEISEKVDLILKELKLNYISKDKCIIEAEKHCESKLIKGVKND